MHNELMSDADATASTEQTPEDRFAVLHELVTEAKRRLDRATWDYVIGGTETETTLKRNRRALDSIAFRPRVLRDVSKVNCSAELFGMKLRIPVFLAPIGSLQDLHPEAGAGAARGAAEFGTAMMQSSNSVPGLEATAGAADGPKMFQLYVRGDRDFVDDHIRRATDHGYQAFCLTVDTDYYSRRERDLSKRHVTTGRRKVTGADFQKSFSWEDVERVRKFCKLPLILKGIATVEDARIACEHGVDGIYVSNHGGRQLDHGRGAIEVLAEIVEAIGNQATVLVDGGMMRGTDVVKAISLGATAVGIGRLFGFSIAAGGQAGVARMLELLEQEIITCMGLLGVSELSGLDESYLHTGIPVVEPHVTSAFPLLEEGY